jgi:hypothetical protein
MTKIKLIDIIIIILFILAVYFILRRIFGHSATDISISVTLFMLLGTLLYKLNREFGEFKVKSVYTFEKMKEDLNLIKKKLRV